VLRPHMFLKEDSTADFCILPDAGLEEFKSVAEETMTTFISEARSPSLAYTASFEKRSIIKPSSFAQLEQLRSNIEQPIQVTHTSSHKQIGVKSKISRAAIMNKKVNLGIQQSKPRYRYTNVGGGGAGCAEMKSRSTQAAIKGQIRSSSANYS